jgi:hypothetical protein
MRSEIHSKASSEVRTKISESLVRDHQIQQELSFLASIWVVESLNSSDINNQGLEP